MIQLPSVVGGAISSISGFSFLIGILFFFFDINFMYRVEYYHEHDHDHELIGIDCNDINLIDRMT